jgi:hypothetical protein
MRRYDDPVDVRRGMVAGAEVPEQFLWHGRLWKVCDVVAHWMETGPWWQSSGVQAVLGSDAAEQRQTDMSGDPVGPPAGGTALATDLVAEREVWRVEAARGAAELCRGVFDLVLDWADGSWRLARCLD